MLNAHLCAIYRIFQYATEARSSGSGQLVVLQTSLGVQFRSAACTNARDRHGTVAKPELLDHLVRAGIMRKRTVRET